MITLKRQDDGSWKWDSEISSSALPPAGTTADGADEKELVEIEKTWAQAMQKSDVAAFKKYLAKEWTYAENGKVTSRSQMLADLKTGAFKIESLKLKDLSPRVFGDAAVVTMTADWNGKYKGAKLSGPMRSIDFFLKRDGKWQAISTQAISMK